MPRRRLASANQIPGRDAGVMDGTFGTRKVIIHTEGKQRGANGRDGDALWLARYTAGQNTGYNFTIDRRGRIGQLYAANVASRAMLPGSWSPNRQGVVAIQVCFAGINSAAELEDWPLDGWSKLLRFFDRWKVPRHTHVSWNHPDRSAAAWRRSGYVSHAHAPFNDHTDGGGAPIKRLLNWDKR
jgi:hypothetical protein